MRVVRDSILDMERRGGDVTLCLASNNPAENKALTSRVQ